MQFGSFVVPSTRDPHGPVRLAQACEQAELDVVSFQDHPYHPGLLDTWTLLSYVAARTERIHLAPGVLNLPLRPPAVVARAATSLDLLTGGRLELALGAGGFWDAIEAMGGRRLAPGQAVAALGEAIDVIRGTWNVADRSRFVVDGKHYRIDGAKRGPAPAHDIGLWVGVYGARMLRLAGHKADGWLPAVPYLESLAAIGRGNAIIDEAAEQAGRSPREIRRLLILNGTIGGRDGFPSGDVSAWAEQLAVLALTDGVATFFLSSDDPTDIRRFGEEIAPEVRRRITAEQEQS